MEDHFTGLENAGLEKGGPILNTGKCRTRKWRTILQGWKMQDRKKGESKRKWVETEGRQSLI